MSSWQKRLILVLLLAAAALTPTFSDNATWYNSSWHVRVPINISYGASVDNLSVNVTLNFTQIFESANMSGASLDYSSLRVVENVTELPLEYYNISSQEIQVIWIANGTVNATNRTFYIYLDSVANGPKPAGPLILDAPFWRSGYLANMRDYSPWVNDTTSTPAIPYNRSWAKRVEVNYKWSVDTTGDFMRLYVDGVQVAQKSLAGGAANDSYWGGSVHGYFFSNNLIQNISSDAYGIYGAAIDTIRFYPVGNYTVAQSNQTLEPAEAQPSNVTAVTLLPQYNFNETLEITGIMSDSAGAPIAGASVNATVYFPNDTLAATNVTLTNSTGGYLIRIFLPWEDPNGTYGVNISAALSSFNASFNRTSFYYTADKIPTIANLSATPSPGGWNEYFNFSINVSDFDANPDEANVTLWVNTSAGWISYQMQNVTPQAYVNWTVKPFGPGDIGTNRTFLIEFSDPYHPTVYNTSEIVGPEVERDDVAIVFFNLTGSPVLRPGAANVTFGAGLLDLDNGTIIAGENLSFWSDSDFGFLFAGLNLTEADGNTTSSYDPDCLVPGGLVGWKANYSGNSLFKPNESALFNYTVIGQLGSLLLLPPQNDAPAQGDFIPFQANVTDECGRGITGASTNFTISNISSFTCVGSDAGGGLYNCTWNSAGYSAGNYSINLTTDRQYFLPNDTFYLFRFYLRTGPPAILLYLLPDTIDQLQPITINASITDFSGFNLTAVVINVTSPANVTYNSTMVEWASYYTVSGWVFNYTIGFPAAWGNTSSKGNYSVRVSATDGIGITGNRTDNFTVYTHVNVTASSMGGDYFFGGMPVGIFYKTTDLYGTPLPGITANLSLRLPSPYGIPYEFPQNPITTDANGTGPYLLFTPAAGVAGQYDISASSRFYDPYISGYIELNTTDAFFVDDTDLQAATNKVDGSTLFINRTMNFIVKDVAYHGHPLSYSEVGEMSVDFYAYIGNVLSPAPWLSLRKANFTDLTNGSFIYDGLVPDAAGKNLVRGYVSYGGQYRNFADIILYIGQGGPFDVIVEPLNNTVPAGDYVFFNVWLANNGTVDGFDVDLSYCIDSGPVCGSSSVAAPAPGTWIPVQRQLFVPAGTALGFHNITATATLPSGSTQPVPERTGTFEVTAASTTTTAPPGGPGGGGFGAAGPITTTTAIPTKPTFGMTISDYPRERDLFVERNSVRFFNIELLNTGTETLHDIGISLSGVPASWYELASSNVSFIDSDQTASFVVRLVVPTDAKAQVYPLTISALSDEANASKVTAITVFASEQERLFYEIQFLKSRYNNLEDALAIAVQNNKNVSDIIEVMALAKEQIDTASKFVDEGALRNASDAIRKAHNYLDRAEFELNRIPQKAPPAQPVISLILPVTAFPYLIALLILLLGIILAIWIVRTIRKMKSIVKKAAASEIKHAIAAKQSTPADLIRNRERVKRALKLIESQYSEKIISKETYEELKKNNERKLAALNRELGVEEQ